MNGKRKTLTILSIISLLFSVFMIPSNNSVRAYDATYESDDTTENEVYDGITIEDVEKAQGIEDLRILEGFEAVRITDDIFNDQIVSKYLNKMSLDPASIKPETLIGLKKEGKQYFSFSVKTNENQYLSGLYNETDRKITELYDATVDIESEDIVYYDVIEDENLEMNFDEIIEKKVTEFEKILSHKNDSGDFNTQISESTKKKIRKMACKLSGASMCALGCTVLWEIPIALAVCVKVCKDAWSSGVCKKVK